MKKCEYCRCKEYDNRMPNNCRIFQKIRDCRRCRDIEKLKFNTHSSSSPSSCSTTLKWEYEDNLDIDITTGMYEASMVKDGVRMYPYVEIEGKRGYIQEK